MFKTAIPPTAAPFGTHYDRSIKMELENVKTGRDMVVMFVVYIFIGAALAIGFGIARLAMSVVF